MNPQGFFGALFGPPRFHFNKNLFKDLIREDRKGRKLPAGEEPDVRFSMGPVDGVLGEYDAKEKRITIDVLENFLVCFFQGPEDIRARFDRRMISTLAHEGAHWRLHKRYGKAVVAEKMAINVLCILVGLLILGQSLHLTAHYFGLAAKALYAGHHPVSLVLATLVLVVAQWVFIKFFLEAWHAITFSVTYKLCYDERYARAAEKDAAVDPRWNNVIT